MPTFAYKIQSKSTEFTWVATPPGLYVFPLGSWLVSWATPTCWRYDAHACPHLNKRNNIMKEHTDIKLTKIWRWHLNSSGRDRGRRSASPPRAAEMCRMGCDNTESTAPTYARHLIPRNVHSQVSHLRTNAWQADQPLHAVWYVPSKLFLQHGWCSLQVLHLSLVKI